MRIPESELIINGDGSVFHLHIKPEHLADKVILVGDPGRVEFFAPLMDSIENRTASREFVSLTGTYRGTRITVLSLLLHREKSIRMIVNKRSDGTLSIRGSG